MSDSTLADIVIRRILDGKIRDLFETYEGKIDLNLCGKQKRTPLMVAAAEGMLSVVQLLLHEGADVRITGQNKMTALHEAAGNGHVEIVDLLIAKGADVNSTSSDGVTH